MNVIARVYCEKRVETGAPQNDRLGSIDGQPNGETLSFRAITSGGPDDPNKTYSQYTPNMTVEMTITNPAVLGHFVPGHIYDLTFTPAPKREPAPFDVAPISRAAANVKPRP
jgi:hypothetical protein